MLLEEYYNSGDLNEAAVSLQVGGQPWGALALHRGGTHLSVGVRCPTGEGRAGRHAGIHMLHPAAPAAADRAG